MSLCSRRLLPVVTEVSRSTSRFGGIHNRVLDDDVPRLKESGESDLWREEFVLKIHSASNLQMRVG